MNLEHYSRLLRKLTQTIRDTEQEVFPQFPFYRKSDESKWQSSNRGAWLSGFWLGCCWLANRFSDSSADVDYWGERCEQLSTILEGDSVFQAMNAWYAFGPAWSLAKDSDAERRLVAYQSQLATLFEPWGGFSLGSDMGGGPDSNRSVSLDPCAAIYELSSVENWIRMPIAHSLHINTHLMDAESRFYAHAKLISQGEVQQQWIASGSAGGWERGQCWGMLALCSAAKQLTDISEQDYLASAALACEYWWQHYWRDAVCQSACQPTQVDPSAMLLAVVAMFKLDELVKGGQWKQRGKAVLDWLIHSPYLVENSDSLRFIGCRYKINKSATDQELIEMPYGYFFLYQALLTATGAINASDF